MAPWTGGFHSGRTRVPTFLRHNYTKPPGHSTSVPSLMAGTQSKFGFCVRRFRNCNIEIRSQLTVSDVSQPTAPDHSQEGPSFSVGYEITQEIKKKKNRCISQQLATRMLSRRPQVSCFSSSAAGNHLISSTRVFTLRRQERLVAVLLTLLWM